ncbi:MAG: helix-turn-helix domain-containing protein [Acidimicrobiales bacterium]
MRLVRESSGENLPSGEIARAVGYSLPHLQHLFRSHVGTSIRSYRTSSRFVSLAGGYAARRSLTDAALAAGFFDSAHLTHAFTKTFGVPPSLVFNDEVEIHVVESGGADIPES